MADVLLIETDVQLTRLIEWIIEGAGHQVRTVARPPDARTELAAAAPDIVVFNSGASRDEKRLLIRSFRDIVPGLRVIDMDENASHPSHDTGADDYIDKPFHADDLIAAIERLARQRTEQDT
jgi:DNA-binding response OmpR family regulator